MFVILFTIKKQLLLNRERGGNQKVLFFWMGLAFFVNIGLKPNENSELIHPLIPAFDATHFTNLHNNVNKNYNLNTIILYF